MPVKKRIQLYLAVKTEYPVRVYALTGATLAIGKRTVKPIDSEQRIRAAQRSASIQKVFSRRNRTSNVEIEDKNGRTVGTATVTTPDPEATQQQIDRINQQTAATITSYDALLRDYDATPEGSSWSAWGRIDFSVKADSSALFRVLIGETLYAIPFDLARTR